ncbi:flagellar biosynthesis protein FlhB [Ectopseudomonas khazarica]|jgi:flagellar biosynthetic protein FlhB|uniref:Flagellar biosynthetic protein FlhB n=2 Tax=Ectopseudomonas TaxID=3236654 RepID=A0A653B3B1_ECTOL|nr:flagellar biosynthesis protein FlhB [Pseudomonas khazarica]QTS86387.1 flagellar type III secretion system protein FlhB [Pseudomonas khazarica]TNF09246.1 MAG: flagellar type III secretion system protein FlhB [Pseudomonadales bacterium]CAE6963770.1 Flagellar biosynthetic protein FlhB [Pseudomonas oleovorans]HIQ44165.1 flagellar type III secretion system protein FlhB [Pseudomonas oleovorans]|tara:strand:+ start:6090 stop:7223 length:1134 start_codon:yes stop_codon:yes gene_type:complete
MSEQNSGQEKTEEASAHKLKKSKEDGQVARSKDLSTTISLIATLFILKFSAGLFMEGLSDSFRLSYIQFGHSEIGLDDLDTLLGYNLLVFIKLLSPLLLTSLLVVALSLVPGGWVFSAKNFAPKLSKLNPITGLGRIVSAQNWSELLKSILKVLVLLAVGYVLVRAALPQLIALQRSSVLEAISAALDLTFNLTLCLMLIFVVFSFIDIPLQRYFFLKKMRMTKQERKEEHKNQEGRPEVKARIKQLQRQMLQRQISKVIKNADVVITNPTHYAVALKYDTKKAQAPFVLAKGVDETALYMRQMAAKHELEVVEVPPLARAIYFTTQVNQQIPAPLYTAVAHVLTYILQLKAWRQGRRSKPQLASNLPIPDSLANRG